MVSTKYDQELECIKGTVRNWFGEIGLLPTHKYRDLGTWYRLVFSYKLEL